MEVEVPPDFRSRRRSSSAIFSIAPWWWWRRDRSTLCHGDHHPDRPRYSCFSRRHRLLLLASIHTRRLRAALLCRRHRWPMGLRYRRRTHWWGADRRLCGRGDVGRGPGHLHVRPFSVDPLGDRPRLRSSGRRRRLSRDLGLTKLTMPSEGWQIAFSVIGAVAVGATAWTRLVAMAPPGQSGHALARR